MTEDDDVDLDRLFERTAAEPSSFELTRMAVRDDDPRDARHRPSASP